VVSSLGSVAQKFDNVWPSPAHPNAPPSEIHAQIADSITRSPSMREAMYIDPDCVYDPGKSVFQGSVKRTVFVKERDDERYHYRHRDTHLFYNSRINWERGDEVLQVCNLSHATILFSLWGRLGAKL
jgi:hypothetical protein